MVALLFLLLAVEPASVADKLTAARGMADALDFAEAREQLLDVVSDPRATQDELFEAHLFAGEIDRILERDVDARMHFLWVLSRRPAAQLPADRPPKVTAFFELVRAEVLAQHRPVSAQNTPPAQEATNAVEAGALLPAVLTIGAGLVAVSGLGLAVFAEAGFADAGAAWADREQRRTLGVASWGAAAVGTVGVGAGAAWWLSGASE